MTKGIIYNVSVQPDVEIAEEWLLWMKEVHIPEVLETGCFLSARICEVRIPAPEGGPGYAIQYTCKDMATLQRYQALHAPQLQKAHTERYQDRFVAFRSVVEILWENQA